MQKFSKEKVLVVDDNVVNQIVAKAMLKKMGVNVDVAADGQEAIDMLIKLPYDLVFMDCQMPVMDGYDATRHIRDEKSQVLNHQIPIVAMTANVMQGDREKCLEAGMDDFLAKPIDLKKLHAQLEKWFGSEADKQTNLVEKEFVSTALIFDYEAMSERLMRDKDLITIIADAFLADMPIQIQEINTLITQSEIEKVTRQAHKIKGASANVGAMQLTELAIDIEKYGKEGDFQVVKEKILLLDLCFEQLKTAMSKEL